MIGGRKSLLSTGRLVPDTIDWARRVRANGGVVTPQQIATVDALARRLLPMRGQITRLNPMVGDIKAIVVPLWKDWGPSLDILVGSPTVDANGLTVAGTTQWLRTGVTPSAQTGWDSTNSHLGVHVVYGNPVGTDNALAGCWSNSGTLRYGFRWTNAASSILVFPGTNAETITRNSRTLGFLSGHRMLAAVAGVVNYYEEGVSVASGTNPTNGLPITELLIGSANGSGLAGNFILGGYHLGGALTSAQALVMGEAWHQMTQTLGRQRSMLATGDSLTANGSWPTLYQTNFSPQSSVTRVATGGITSATCLANLTAAIAATPALKWHNTHVWICQNDGGTNYGATSIANTVAILALIPHTKFRVNKMIYKSVSTEWNGQSVRAQKQTVSTYLASTYGTRALDYGLVLTTAGGTAVAGTVAQDARDVANGIVPASYHNDLASPATITAITKATNAQITATAHGCINGDTVWISGTVVGMTQIQGIYDTVTVIDANNLTLDHTDSTAFSTYTSGGSLTIKDSIHVNPTADGLIATNLNASVSGGW